MSSQLGSQSSSPCIWMTAGLVSYKLCDRSFDCEHCPFDAALRGAAGAEASSCIADPPGHRPTVDFPEDRRYTLGHTWAGERREEGKPVIRLGLDAFAARLLGHCEEVQGASPGRRLRRGEAFCSLALSTGPLVLTSPLPGRVSAVNEELGEAPERVVEEPYGHGWILDLEPEGDEGYALLLGAATARERVAHDLRHFRRRVALYLLAESPSLGATLPDGGAPVTDIRQILGPGRYLELLRELIH
jgi:glycine cleavage system H protein